METRTKRILLVHCGVFVLAIGGVAWLGYTLFSLDSARNLTVDDTNHRVSIYVVWS